MIGKIMLRETNSSHSASDRRDALAMLIPLSGSLVNAWRGALLRSLAARAFRAAGVADR
jgi:hypothetical protein